MWRALCLRKFCLVTVEGYFLAIWEFVEEDSKDWQNMVFLAPRIKRALEFISQAKDFPL